MSQVVRFVAGCAVDMLTCGGTQAGVESLGTPLDATIQANSGELNFEHVFPLFHTQCGTRMLTDVQISGTAIMTADTQVTNADTFLASFTVHYAGRVSGFLPSGIFSTFQLFSQSEPTSSRQRHERFSLCSKHRSRAQSPSFPRTHRPRAGP